MDVPASLRRWFVAHFGVNLLIGAPLMLVPDLFLRAMGWTTVDGASARMGGAAMVAVGVQSLLTRNGGPGTLRMMLNFKLLWSWALIAGLVFAAADDAPDPVWVLLAFFLGLSSVWFYFRMQFEGEVEEDEDHQDLLPAGGDELSDLMHLGTSPGDASRAIDSVGAQDINALFAARAAEEAREAKAAKQAAAEEAEEAEAPPSKTMPGIAPEKRAEMDELDALLAASATTGIDDKKAERLADLLAARKAARERGETPKPIGLPGADEPNEGEATGTSGEAESLGGADIAAMLANGPEEKTLGSDEIAAMLGEGGEGEGGGVGQDDIAAMLAANQAGDADGDGDEAVGGPTLQGESPRATGEDGDEGKGDGEGDGDGGGERAVASPSAGEAGGEESVGMDDIAAMLAGNGEGAEEPARAEEPAPEDEPLGSDGIAALLAGNDRKVSSEDLAALLAGNEGGSTEPPSIPTLRGRADAAAMDIDPDDEAILFTEDTPPPEPTEATAEGLAEGLVADANPRDTVDEAADEDSIAAMLAASRGEEA